MDNLRRRAIRTFFRAKSFIFLKVVFCFNLLNPKIGISFAIHSSANELETTFTPSKSKITHSEDSIVATTLSGSIQMSERNLRMMTVPC